MVLFSNYAVVQSFFDVFNKPTQSILETFLSFCWACSNSPLSIFNLFHFQILQYLYNGSLTSSGCSAWTRSCLLANINRGTPESYFSYIVYLLQLRASQVMIRPI